MAINFIPKGWWPFKKKNVIYNESMFTGFGASTVVWNQVYKSQQDNNLLVDYFNNVAEVAAPVLKYSDGASQIGFKTNITEIETLLNNPNYYQGFSEWFSQVILYKRLFGESIINMLVASKLNQDFSTSRKPTNLYNLSPQFTNIKLTELNKRDFRDNTIEKYIFDSDENNVLALEIDPEFILHLKESNPNFVNNQYLFGESRYAGCSKNIQSIVEGYSAKVNLYKNGPRLIITGKSQGDFSSANTSDNVENVQKKLEKYGRGEGQYQNMMTDIPLSVYNASLNVRDLQLNENNQSDFDRLCDAQGLDSKIFSKEAKFEDKKSALKDFYNNSFRAEIDSTFNDIENYLKTWWSDIELTPDYSQISEIVEANNEENRRLLEDAEKGLMTRNEYLEAIGKGLVLLPEFSEYFVYDGKTWISLNNIQNENTKETL